jgi:hypothetical protein
LGAVGSHHGRTLPSKVVLLSQSTPGGIRKKITLREKKDVNGTASIRRKIPADYNNEITTLGELLIYDHRRPVEHISVVSSCDR